MVEHRILPLKPKPGVQRDGTQFDSPNYINAQHTRFYRGLPRKVGGYQLLNPGTIETIRTLFSVPKDNSFDLYIGRGSGVYVINYFTNHISSPEVDRTPADYNELPDSPNVWSFDLFTGTNEDNQPVTYIIANVRPDADQINASAVGRTYYGDINSIAPLEPIPPLPGPPLTWNGGIVTIDPYLFGFGEKGVVGWSETGNPLIWPSANIATISSYKIIAGKKGWGGSAPTVLFWSTNSLIRGTFVGGDAEFSFGPVDGANTSIISDTSIVQYDQVYYWIGVDQFYYYQGVVKKLPNSFSTNWFFDNVNQSHLDKIFGISIKRFGEIWWFYPKGTATECTDVIIYNIEENTWYDTRLPRSAAISANQYTHPIMADSTTIRNLSAPDIDSGQYPITYPIWTHELGVNRVLFNEALAIDSYFETPIMTLATLMGIDKQLRVRRIETDFVQTGDMNVIVIKRGFAQGEISVSDPYIFGPNTPKIDMAEMGRLVSLQFQSNILNGDFQMGNVLLSLSEGDVNPNS